jgi:GAF domain-containing protein
MGSSLERSRDELTALADEQAGLRRVATLVAQGESAEDGLAAVAGEIGQLLPADYVLLSRYDADADEMTTVGRWSHGVGARELPAAWQADVRTLAERVRRSGRPERTQAEGSVHEPAAANGRFRAIRSSVGVPIKVEAELWGVVIVASERAEPLPEGTEARLGSFTELVSTAIANAEAKSALTESRARIIVTADETRRQLQRDLHDGAQQRFVNVMLRLHLAQMSVPPDLPGSPTISMSPSSS